MKKKIQKIFPQFSGALGFFESLASSAEILTVRKQTILLKEGAYIKQIPIVMKGLVKVFKEEENGNEVLLYYISPGESCILSIVAAEKNEKSKVKAVVEEDSELLLISVGKINDLSRKHLEWKRFVYSLIDEKFNEVIKRVKTLTFSNKIVRLYEYLQEESKLKNNSSILHSHQEIANELGSSREVISRLLKKLEQEGKIKLSQRKIELL